MTALARVVLGGTCVLAMAAAAAGPSPPAGVEGTVRVLTAPALAGRGAGSPGAAAAADSLAGWLAAAGLVPAFAGEWSQEFPLRDTEPGRVRARGATGRNIAGVLPGRDGLAGRWLVLGAHYDHLGRRDGAVVDAPPDSASYFPGANDNASGVAVVVEVLRSLAARPDSGDARSVLAVFFDAEEIGLQGSGHLVEFPPWEPGTVDVMINLDTVGRLHDGLLHVSGVGSSPALADAARSAAGASLVLRLADAAWPGSDHVAFARVEVPALFLFGGPYPQYNSPADRWEILDPAALSDVTGFTERLVRDLRGRPEPLPWVATAADTGPDADTTAVPQNRATWLGTMPAFDEGVEGYVLGGVFDDSPAARAGLREGDVLLRLGDAAVSDLATFTRALRSHAPGEIVELELDRHGTRLRFTIVLGDRADRR